jgi:3-oxoadipate enol-lactonase
MPSPTPASTVAANPSPAAAPDPTVGDVAAPWRPPTRTIELPGRGELRVRDSGVDDRPTVLLLHGWGVTADLNWSPAYAGLAADHRVVAFDHAGHGRGVRPAGGIVRLSHLADDAVAVMDQLGIAHATVVGYSMGGAVAQLVWKRHGHRVRGLVLASTARHFQGGPISDLWYRSYTPLAHLAEAASGPAQAVVRARVDRRVRGNPDEAWMREELEAASPAALLSSMRSIGRFRSNSWIGDVDVPTSVIVTSKDRTVPTRKQRGLAKAIPGAAHLEVEGPHDAIVTRADEYVPVLLDAVAHAT